MDRALISLIEPMQGDMPGVVLDHDVTLSELLAHPALADCLRRGIVVMRDGRPEGCITADRLAPLVAGAVDALREERDQARAERTAIVANLGHELRTPINAIIGYAELIMAKQGGKAAGDGYVEVILEAAHHLLGTIDSILDLTRIEANAVELRESVVDVAGLMRSVARLLASSAGVREIVIHSTVPADFPRLYADARMLRQMLINLVTNAVKYTRGETEILLSARIGAKGDMRLEVQDQGPGIRRAAVKLAMQPFKQLSERGFGAVAGAGLGLPLVNALVELHGGRFRLISAPGRGTRAVITMPASRVRAGEPCCAIPAVRTQAQASFHDHG